MQQTRRTYGADYGATPLKSSIRIRPTRIGPPSSNTFRMPRRQHITVLMVIALVAFIGGTLMLTFRGGSSETSYVGPIRQEPVLVEKEILLGTATAPKLENATLK